MDRVGGVASGCVGMVLGTAGDVVEACETAGTLVCTPGTISCVGEALGVTGAAVEACGAVGMFGWVLDTGAGGCNGESSESWTGAVATVPLFP